MAAIQIVIAGLCSLLNVRGEYSTLPEPSVIAVRTGLARGHTAKHTPYIAWDSDLVDVTFDDPAKFKEEKVSGADHFHYVAMDGELVTLDDKKTGPPDASEFDDIASYLRYARDPASTDWDRCYIPKAQGLPDRKCVAGFMRFGGGTLTTARLTDDSYGFEDDAGSTGLEPAHYAQEVIYTTVPSGMTDNRAYADFVLSRLEDSGTKRAVRFAAKTAGADVVIFFGNHLPQDIVHAVNRKNTNAGVEVKGLHFHALGLEVNDSDVPVPVLQSGSQSSSRPVSRRLIRPTPRLVHSTSKHDGGPTGDSTGYCGPDSKP